METFRAGSSAQSAVVLFKVDDGVLYQVPGPETVAPQESSCAETLAVAESHGRTFLRKEDLSGSHPH